MSTSALFSNNPIRSGNKNLVEFKAGKMTMKGSMVHPDNRKGQLYVYQSDDSLMHFCWKDRTSGVVEDDLIIFPDDCEFKHVSQCKTGRVYLLRFKSSNRKFFFWLQDIKTDKDEELCKKINEVLNNPPALGAHRNGGAADGDLQNLLNNMSQQQLMQLFGGVGQIGGFGNLLGSISRPYGNRPSSSSGSTRTSSSTAAPAPTETSSEAKETTETPKSSEPQPIQFSDLQNFLSNIPGANGSTIDGTLQKAIADEFTKTVLSSVTTNEDLEALMKTHLPPNDNFSTTLTSAQFSQAMSMFWSAIQSKQVAAVIRQFGFNSEAVNAAEMGDIERFINAINASEPKNDKTAKSEAKSEPEAKQAKKDDDEEMAYE